MHLDPFSTTYHQGISHVLREGVKVCRLYVPAPLLPKEETFRRSHEDIQF